MERKVPLEAIETLRIRFDGVPLIVPLIDGRPPEFPGNSFKHFPSYCGAGKGMGDKIIPETVWLLPISPACYIHDIDFEIAPASWEAFHSANGRFMTNILSIIREKSLNVVFEHLRNYRAVSYYNAVDTVGAKCFWRLKRKQRYEIPITALKYSK